MIGHSIVDTLTSFGEESRSSVLTIPCLPKTQKLIYTDKTIMIKLMTLWGDSRECGPMR